MRFKYYMQNHVNSIVAGFKRDGYDIVKTIVKNNRIGIAAEHRKAFNYDTGAKKKVYYLEGTSYQMGYLMGLMAEKDISRMTTEFIRKIVSDFINNSDGQRRGLLEDTIFSIVNNLYKGTFNNLPYEIREELYGIYEGCREVNPKTQVDMKRLFVLNSGIDILCAIIYSGKISFERIDKLIPEDFKVPLFCNGFSISGKSAGRGHYFGRDFMFPTADVFQDTAAHVIYRPVAERVREPLPFVSVTSPGLAGSISAMNIRGVASGVDMSPSGNCNPSKVGTNSVLLTRMAVQYGTSAAGAVDIIEKTQRGVSWNYIIADGHSDRACIVEAGATSDTEKLNCFKYASGDFIKQLPDLGFIDQYKSVEFKRGLMVRWNNYKYPVEYLDFNNRLMKHYNKLTGLNKVFYENVYNDRGYINSSWSDNNCPSTFYFAPQRENLKDIVLTTNHYIIPEMRYYSMYPWTSRVIGKKINDIQWRYDELNNQIVSTIEKKGYIDYYSARKLADFLAPYGKFPEYYKDNPRSKDEKELRIKGCVSLFDLKRKTVESHYGYYCDDWVKLTLPYYV